MKRNLAFHLCAVVAVAGAANAANVAGQIKALREEIKSNSVSRTTRCQYYKAWYVGMCTKEELDAMVERNVAAHRRWMELAPNDPAPHSDIGCVLAAAGRWKEAKAELDVAIAAGDKLDAVRRAQCRWEMANFLWKGGDIEGAKKLVAEVADLAKVAKGALYPMRKAQYLHRAWTDPDGDLDVFTLPHSTDGKPFPTPQKATYGEKKVSLARVELKFRTNGTAGTDGTSPASRISPVSPKDPIIRLLKRKLTRFGSTFAPGGTPLEIEISPSAPVDKPQGYSLDVANGKVVIKARSRQGAIWGVISLIQCVDRGGLAIRECEIRDWPKCQRRGVIDYWDWNFLEYALFNKMNCMNIRMDPPRDYVPSPLDRERYRLWCARFREFGIEMFCGSGNITMSPLLPLSSPRTRKLHVGWARFVASVGAGFAIHLDDYRFPMHPLDIENAGTAANLDAKYITGIYREVKKDHPDFKMLFCPPFYWGPDGASNLYPEPRDPYLKSLGTDLDPEIEVFWTGPRVKSMGMTSKKTKWYSDLIGRKPVIFHNSDCIGRHNHIPYGADATGYKASHSPELFDLISAFMHNMTRYQGSPFIGSCMDWCWNPDAHDPTVAVRRNDEQLEGPGVFELLRDATPAIEYFDKYPFGSTRSELLTEDPEDLDKRVATAEVAWTKVQSIAHNRGLFVGDFNDIGIHYGKKLANLRHKPPKWLVEKRDAEMANTRFAVNEVGFDESKGDVFFPAELLNGGAYVKDIGDWSKRSKRNVKYVSVGTELSGRFTCEPFPPDRPYKLVFMGLQWNANDAVAEVEVNGRKIWSGTVFPKKRHFNPLEIEIPVDSMQRSNRFVFRNSAPSAEAHRKPIVHYAVIKK